jgi:hypothetical protein
MKRDELIRDLEEHIRAHETALVSLYQAIRALAPGHAREGGRTWNLEQRREQAARTRRWWQAHRRKAAA